MATTPTHTPNLYLVFRLYSPLVSWGEIAVGQARHTAAHPSRSALLGLLAAALGIERSEEDTHRQLARSLRFGVKLVLPGHPLRDFHTIQAPSTRRGVRLRTRRQELASDDLNTLLSFRDYRTDSLAIIAAQAKEGSPWTLSALADALRAPVFPLFLGRKSCPPALPLAPQVVEAGTLKEALDTPQRSLAALSNHRNCDKPWGCGEDRYIFRPDQVRYSWEEGMVARNDETLPGPIEFSRHDQPLSRARWQFAPRREWVHLCKHEPFPTPSRTLEGDAA